MSLAEDKRLYKLISIDGEIEQLMRQHRKGFESRNDVLRRLLGLPKIRHQTAGRPKGAKNKRKKKEDKHEYE